MTDYVDAWPTARKRHRCGVCRRAVLPGETYWRQAGLDRGSSEDHACHADVLLSIAAEGES